MPVPTAPIATALGLANFTPWFSVEDYLAWEPLPQATKGALRSPGVYVAAPFTVAPPNVADPLAREVEYIGMTEGQSTSLFNRVGAFINAAGGGTAFHSGGHRWHAEALPPVFYMAVAPVPDARNVGWQIQASALWPVLVESSLLFLFADRHAAYPKANAAGWVLPGIPDALVDMLLALLTAPFEGAPAAALAPTHALRKLLGYSPGRAWEDRARYNPDWHGAETVLPKSGCWLWLGRSRDGDGVAGIWDENHELWWSANFTTADEARTSVTRLVHAWRTSR